MEPGETIEAAVAREIKEEAGIDVADVRYIASQPWPFPSSIMLGFMARAATTELNIATDEIETALSGGSINWWVVGGGVKAADSPVYDNDPWVQFARAEGIIPAPEPTHALASVIEEAKRCTESGEQKVILTALCGHGHFDMAAYERYLSGEMEDFELSQERIDDALTRLPAVGS